MPRAPAAALAAALAAMIAPMIAMPTLATAAHAQGPARIMSSNFSRIESLAAAQELAKRGVLVPVLLFPAELGGADIPPNTVYITPEAAAERAKAIAAVIALLEKGKVDQMDVKPAYKGTSFVPSSIAMKAWHTRTGETFEVTIPVW